MPIFEWAPGRMIVRMLICWISNRLGLSLREPGIVTPYAVFVVGKLQERGINSRSILVVKSFKLFTFLTHMRKSCTNCIF